MDLSDAFNQVPDRFESTTSSSLLEQLKEKLKSQAQKIRQLESYKLLCEERIKDFSPSHPIPVLRDHIGVKPLISESLALKQKIAKLELQLLQNTENVPTKVATKPDAANERYNNLYEKLKIVQREKKELEETLRDEMQASEEQRTYIEILKQTIEINIENLELRGITIEEFANYAHLKVALEENNKKLNYELSRAHDLEFEIESLKEILEARESEIESLYENNEQLSQEISQVNGYLKASDDEIQKIEEEKSRLIEYIETQTKSDQQFNQEIKDLKEKINTMENEYSKLLKNYKKSNEDYEKYKSEFEAAKNENLKNSQALKDSIQSFIGLKSRVEEKDRIIQKKTEEINELLKNKSNIDRELEVLNLNTHEKEEEIQKSYQKLENLIKDYEKIKNSLKKSEEYHTIFKEKSEKLENELRELTQNYQKLNEKYEETQKRYNTEINHAAILEKQIQEERKQHNDLAEAEKFLAQKYSNLEKTFRDTESEKNGLIAQNKSLTSELGSVKDQNEQNSFKVQSLVIELSQLESQKLHIQRLLETEKSTSKQFQTEINELKQKIERLNEVLYISNQNFQDRTNRISELETENTRLAETLKSLQIDLENHKYEKISKSDELCRVSVQNENSLYEIDKLKYFYRTTCDEIIKTIDLFFPGQFQKNSVEFFFDDYLITWVRKLNEEIENTLKKYTDQHKLLVCTQQANKTLSSNLETISQECNQLKSKEIQHRNQIENQLEEINYIKESFKTQIASFQQEIISLRQDLKSLHEENESTTDKSRKQSAEIMNLKYKLSSSELDRLALEEKYSLIKNEKSNIASLVKKIQHLIISPQFQRLINEILRVHSELEFSQLEKLRVSMQLRNPDEITDQSLLETLRKQFSLCESNIISYLNKLQSLEDQLIHEKSFIST